LFSPCYLSIPPSEKRYVTEINSPKMVINLSYKPFQFLREAIEVFTNGFSLR